MNQMNSRREPTPAQRNAKIERDRRRRREHNMEFQRLQKSEAHLTASVVRLRNEVTKLRDNEERLNSEVSRLTDIIHEQRQENLKLQETLNQVNSWIDFANYLSPNEEVASDDPITQCLGSSQNAIQYADDVIAKYIATNSNQQQQTKPSQ